MSRRVWVRYTRVFSMESKTQTLAYEHVRLASDPCPSIASGPNLVPQRWQPRKCVVPAVARKEGGVCNPKSTECGLSTNRPIGRYI